MKTTSNNQVTKTFRFSVMFLAVALLFVSIEPASADDAVGRYEVYQFDDNGAFMVDTATGRSWRLEEPLSWVAMVYTRIGPDNIPTLPEGGASATERWREEGSSRRLELLAPSSTEVIED